jgi:hypothetical protein
MKFPNVRGSNLLRQNVSLPADLQGELNIVFIAFQQWQQAQVDSWVPFARQVEESFSGIQFYELPVIQKMNFLSQTFINEGMRAGIPNPATRQRTITLYLDKRSFRRALDIPHEETIRVLLVGRDGTIHWGTDGAYTPEKGTVLLQAIQEHSRITA